MATQVEAGVARIRVVEPEGDGFEGARLHSSGRLREASEKVQAELQELLRTNTRVMAAIEPRLRALEVSLKAEISALRSRMLRVEEIEQTTLRILSDLSSAVHLVLEEISDIKIGMGKLSDRIDAVKGQHDGHTHGYNCSGNGWTTGGPSK